MNRNAIMGRLSALFACMLVACFALAALTACGGQARTKAELKDGTYTAQSSVFEGDDEAGSGYGEITITVSGGKITAAEFLTYQPDGTLKDESYGMTANGNEDFYNKAQKAVQACDQYAAELVSKGSVDDVDVVSGATVNYKQFQEAADAALADAAK